MVNRALLTLVILAALTGTVSADVAPEPKSKGLGLAFWIAIGVAVGLAGLTALRGRNKK
jgi:hypothetical protein